MWKKVNLIIYWLTQLIVSIWYHLRCISIAWNARHFYWFYKFSSNNSSWLVISHSWLTDNNKVITICRMVSGTISNKFESSVQVEMKPIWDLYVSNMVFLKLILAENETSGSSKSKMRGSLNKIYDPGNFIQSQLFQRAHLKLIWITWDCESVYNVHGHAARAEYSSYKYDINKV